MKFDWNSFLAKGGILKAAIGAGILGGGTALTIHFVKKARKKKEKLNNTDPTKFFKNEANTNENTTAANTNGVVGSMGLPDPGFYDPKNFASMYTVVDPNTGNLNDLGKSIMDTIEKELFAPFYTNDNTIMGALKQIKTQGDWASLQNYWNKVIMPARNSVDNLASKMAEEMSSSKYADLIDFVNKLPYSMQ